MISAVFARLKFPKPYLKNITVETVKQTKLKSLEVYCTDCSKFSFDVEFQNGLQVSFIAIYTTTFLTLEPRDMFSKISRGPASL